MKESEGILQTSIFEAPRVNYLSQKKSKIPNKVTEILRTKYSFHKEVPMQSTKNDMHFMYMQYKHHDNGKQNSQLQISKKRPFLKLSKIAPQTTKKMDFLGNPMNFPNLGPILSQVQGLGFYLLFVSGSPGKLVFLGFTCNWP